MAASRKKTTAAKPKAKAAGGNKTEDALRYLAGKSGPGDAEAVDRILTGKGEPK